MTTTLDEKLRQTLIQLLKLNFGLSVGFCSLCDIYQLENGQFVVEFQASDYGDYFYREFKEEKLDDAVDCFVQKRCEYQCGFDFVTK